MPLTFHWFPPTRGDSGGVVGVGHGADVVSSSVRRTREPFPEYPRQSGHPRLEETHWFGEGVPPLLRERGLWHHPDGPEGTDAAPRHGSPSPWPDAPPVPRPPEDRPSSDPESS